MSETNAISNLVTGAAAKPVLLDDKWGRQHILRPKLISAGSGSSSIEYIRDDITPKGAVKIDPAFIDQNVNIDQAQSLIDYVNRFKTANTVILADVDDLEVVAVIDYHSQGSTTPGLAEHHAILTLSYSAEWQEWQSIDGRMYDQKAFARLLDINSGDIMSPDSATLLETVMDMEMSTSIRVARRLEATGSARGDHSAERKTTGTVLPPFFLLEIPIFTGEPKVQVRAMTKDNQDGNTGKISLGLDLVRTRILVETELGRIARGIAEATEVPVMMGSLGSAQ